MSEPVTSRAIIARQAEAAARGKAPKVNPYCEHVQPEHHKVWAESFASCVSETEGAA